MTPEEFFAIVPRTIDWSQKQDALLQNFALGLVGEYGEYLMMSNPSETDWPASAEDARDMELVDVFWYSCAILHVLELDLPPVFYTGSIIMQMSRVCEMLKKIIYHNKTERTLDLVVNARKLASSLRNVVKPEAMQAVHDKLMKRYPDGFVVQ